LLNIVLASTENHVPQLVYGWDGKRGNKVAICDWQGTHEWILRTIPDAGFMYPLDSFTADESLDIYVYYYNDTEDLFGLIEGDPASDERVYNDGIEVNSNGINNRFIGLVTPVNRISTYQAPIRCDTYNSLWNAENQTEQVMYRQPYAGDAHAAGSNTTWQKAENNDDYTITCLVGPGSIYTAIGRVIITAGCPNADFAVMIDTAGTPIVGINNGGQAVSTWSGDNELTILFNLSEGLHDVFLMNKDASATDQYFYYSGNCWTHRGRYMG
jgi:hypothetical protein